jgi:oleate hydratase
MAMSATTPEQQIYLVGGGIASLAAAAFMIRDGDILRQHLTILEESNSKGGSLDGSGSPEKGYVLRSGLRRRCPA